ncbi:MAG: sensor histidine kinase [Pseudonocardiaceae bacterium]
MKIPGWITKGIHIPPSARRDALLLTVLYLFNCLNFSAWSNLGQVTTKPWVLLVWLYGLAGLVPLAWRNSAPVTVFATQWVHTVAAWPFIEYYTPVVGIPVALYAVAVHCGKKISFLILLASLISTALAAAGAAKAQPTFDEQISSFIPNAIFLALMAAGAWGAGRLTQASKLHVQHLEYEQEVSQREREMAREAEVLAAERRRIARELHDIVSHAVTVIVLQAAGAARVTNPHQVSQSLGHIETTAKQTMAELRRLLGVLEASDCATGIDELGPQPGLTDLNALLASLQTTGMRVTVDVEGTPRDCDLDPSVDLAAYRIVQEGLTNVLKHAGKDATPQLWLIWETYSLLIQIDNGTNLAEAPRKQPTSIGHGLAGLRERAHAVGGELRAGPHRGGGYRLTAILPLATRTTLPGAPSTTVPGAFTQDRVDQGNVST